MDLPRTVGLHEDVRVVLALVLGAELERLLWGQDLGMLVGIDRVAIGLRALSPHLAGLDHGNHCIHGFLIDLHPEPEPLDFLGRLDLSNVEHEVDSVNDLQRWQLALDVVPEA